MPISDHVSRHPDKPAVIFEPSGKVLTYRALDDNSLRLAHLLRAHGLSRGDHIALLMENRPEFIEVVFAGLRAGIYVTAINQHLSGPEAAYILNDCDAKALVTSSMLAGIAREALKDAPNCTIRLATGEAGEPFHSYRAAIASHPAELSDPSPGDMLLYSSGTTGRPKGIKRPLTEGLYWRGSNPSPIPEQYGFDADSIYLSPAPLYHAAPLAYTIGALTRGGTMVAMEKFDPLAALGLIERHRITHSQWVPTMFIRMLKLPEEDRNRFDFSSHRCAIHAAAPCPAEIKRQMIEWWGPIVEEYYSSTERIGSTQISSAEWLAHPGSVGRPSGATIIHICADNGEELPPGEPGLIYLEQPKLVFGYHKDDAKTASALHPHHPTWVTVGDVGRVDEEGYLYLTDRQSFMIISGGVNIYPQAIEDALVMHPDVADVAVIGVPNPEMGEEVKAVVQLQPGTAATPELAEALITFLRPKIARYAIPRSVDFVAELPRLPTGKLYKRALRAHYWPQP